MSTALLSFFWPFGALHPYCNNPNQSTPIRTAKCCLQHDDNVPPADAPPKRDTTSADAPAKDTHTREESPAPPPATPSLPSDAASDPPAADTPGSHPLKRQVEFDPHVEQQTYVVADTQLPPVRSAPAVPATNMDAGTVRACDWCWTARRA